MIFKVVFKMPCTLLHGIRLLTSFPLIALKGV